MLDQTFIELLISYPKKCEWLELKDNWFHKDDIGKYISALSNSAAYCDKEYAYMIWGVNDKNHEIVGTTFDPYMAVNGTEPLQHYIERQLTPSVFFSFTEMLVQYKRIVVLQISKAKSVPTAFQDQRYIRIGSRTEKLSKFPEHEAHLFKLLTNSVDTINNKQSEYQDLSFTKLIEYYNQRGLQLNEKNFKENLGLLTIDGKYNILAQLLSDNSHINIRFALFNGRDKNSTMYSVKEFGNDCILASLSNILSYADLINIPQSDEQDRIVERKEVPLFDKTAFREAAINAFLHNDWVDGHFPMFTLYNNRIEILSRGTLPKKLSLKGFYEGESMPVNEKLAKIFLLLHISEQTGRGVPKIINACGKEAFVFNENSIIVNIPLNIIGDNPIIKSIDNTPKDLSDSDYIIIDEIRNNCNITTSQLCQLTKLSEASVARHLKKLQTKGIIKRVGARKNGYWTVL